VYAIHGVRVPAHVVEHPELLTPEIILAEPNQEVRRVMVERLGWDRFIDDAELLLVDESDDPGNPGRRIALYDLGDRRVFEEPVRVLLCTNGSPERDGTVRRFGLTTPATCNTALEAAAWTYGLEPAAYAGLERRT
jgi:hypothetical protein